MKLVVTFFLLYFVILKAKTATLGAIHTFRVFLIYYLYIYICLFLFFVFLLLFLYYLIRKYV